MEAINKISKVEGIVAAGGGEKSALVFAFNGAISDDERRQWSDIFNNLTGLMALVSDEEEVRLVLSGTTLLLRRGGNFYMGAVVVKGHPVVKSLQRMVKRALKKMGAPAVRTDSRPTPPAPAPAPQSVPQPTPDPPGGDGDLDHRF